MSTKLSLEEIISWKGKTFSQITANIRENTVNTQKPEEVPILTTKLIMNSQPLKLYRKEIASVPLKTCNRRTSTTISDMMETPGVNIVNSKIIDANTNGLVNQNDPNLPNVLGEYPGSSCDTPLTLYSPGTDVNLVNRCLSVQNNALRKVRSSGMIPRKFNNFNKYTNNDTYYTSAGQYLDSRNKTFDQNSFHMLRKGDASCLPGSAASQENVYASNTTAHCSGDPNNYQTSYVPVYYKPSNSKFAEQGGVSSSARILRLKYDTITDAGSKLRSSFGKETASALAYSTTNSSIASLKAKMGYPNKKTPVIKHYYNNSESTVTAPVINYITPAITTTYKYNTAANCFACYSIRVIIATYTGPVLKLTRDLDNTSYDFYTDCSQNYFSTDIYGSGIPYSTWVVGSSKIYVTKWYDQSGKGNHAISLDNQRSPQISIQNNKYVLYFPNAPSTQFFLNITNPIQSNTVFAHFYPIKNSSNISTLVQAVKPDKGSADYSLRFVGSTTTAVFNSNEGDWYSASSSNGGGTQIAYNNNASTTTINYSVWNAFSISIQNPYWSTNVATNLAFGNIGYDVNGGNNYRAMTGYVVEMFFHNTTMLSTDMQYFYTNRLF